jgi:hypothetical protein
MTALVGCTGEWSSPAEKTTLPSWTSDDHIWIPVRPSGIPRTAGRISVDHDAGRDGATVPRHRSEKDLLKLPSKVEVSACLRCRS